MTDVKNQALKILVVDDDHDLLLVCKEFLSPYQVYFAHSYREALEMLRKEPPDVVLSDVCLSDGSGYDVSNLVHKASKDLHVILMSGFTDPDMMSKGILSGAISCIEKPFSRKQLLREVEFAVRGKRS